MIIGIVGRIRAGKTTVAKHYANTLGYTIRPMAKPLKAAAKIIFDWNDEHVSGKLKDVIDERFGISPRQVLQNLGTEWSQFNLGLAFPEFGNVTGRRLWAKNFALEYKRSNPITPIIVDDIRFQHEIDVIKEVESKSLIIRIIRPDFDVKDGHASEEQEGLTVDDVIYNDGSISELFKNAEIVLSRYLYNINNFLLPML